MAGVSDMQQSPEGSTRGGGGREMPSAYGTPPAQQLDFYQAMADFKVMFPNMDEEIIEAVLRANNGGVDATIDQLLTMSIDTNDDVQTYKKFAEAMAPPDLLDSTSSSEEGLPPPTYTNYLLCSESSSSPAVASPSRPRPTQQSPSVTSPPSSNLLDLSLSEFLLPVAPPLPLRRNTDLLMDITPFPGGLHDAEIASLGPPPNAPVPMKKSPMRRDTPKLQSSPARMLYRKWNPPMLGRLPDDFLRLVLPPGGDVCSPGPTSSPCHVSPSISCQSKSSPRKHRSTTPGNSHHMEPSPSEQRVLSSSMLQRRLVENDVERSCARDSSERLQYLEDERLALMLQNAEFLEELRGDEDFMKMLEKDRMNATAFEPAVQLDVRRPAASQLEGYGDHDSELAIGAFPFDRDAPPGVKDEHTEFRQQLNHMGRASRKKFVDVARKFFQRKKKLKPVYPSPVLDWQAQRDGYNQLDNSDDDMFTAASYNSPAQRSNNIDTTMRVNSNAADSL